MKPRFRFKLLVLITSFLTFVCSTWAEENYQWPTHNIKAHWDFTKSLNVDLLNGDIIEFNDEKNDDGEYIFVKQLLNGKTTIRSSITIPYKISELDSFTVVLKYSIESKVLVVDSVNKTIRGDFDSDILDEEVFFLHSKCVLEADDDVLKLWGYTDDSLGYYSVTELDIIPDENNEFNIVISYKKPVSNSIPFAKRNILFGCGTGGKMKYYYTNFKKKNVHFITFEEFNDNDKIQIESNYNNDAQLVEIVFYDGLLSSEDLAKVMDTDSVEVYQPGDDYSSWWDWRYIVYAVLAFIVIMNLKIHKLPKKYMPITANYIERRYGRNDSSEKREEALRYISELWMEFGNDKKKPVYPNEPKKVRDVFEKALATGCVDKDVLSDYNSLAALINGCEKVTLYPYAGMLGAIAVFLIASAGAFFNKQWEYELHSNSFVVNWVAMVMCIVASLYVFKGTPGEKMENPRLAMGLMRLFGQFMGSVMISVGTVLASVVLLLVGALIIVLYGFISSIHTIVWVSVNTGRVIGTSVGGVGVGLLIGFGFIYLIVWLFSFLWPFIEWVLILSIPFIVYRYSRTR